MSTIPDSFHCVEIVADERCMARASVEDTWSLESTDGDVEHVKTSCEAGHRLFLPTDMLMLTLSQIDLVQEAAKVKYQVTKLNP